MDAAGDVVQWTKIPLRRPFMYRGRPIEDKKVTIHFNSVYGCPLISDDPSSRVLSLEDALMLAPQTPTVLPAIEDDSEMEVDELSSEEDLTFKEAKEEPRQTDEPLSEDDEFIFRPKRYYH